MYTVPRRHQNDPLRLQNKVKAISRNSDSDIQSISLANEHLEIIDELIKGVHGTVINIRHFAFMEINFTVSKKKYVQKLYKFPHLRAITFIHCQFTDLDFSLGIRNNDPFQFTFVHTDFINQNPTQSLIFKDMEVILKFERVSLDISILSNIEGLNGLILKSTQIKDIPTDILSKLQTLHIMNMNLPFLEKLNSSGINELIFSGVQIENSDQILQSIAKMVWLEELHLTSLGISEFSIDLERFKHLNELNLSHNKITNIVNLGKLDKIQNLDISHNNQLRVRLRDLVEINSLLWLRMDFAEFERNLNLENSIKDKFISEVVDNYEFDFEWAPKDPMDRAFYPAVLDTKVINKYGKYGKFLIIKISQDDVGQILKRINAYVRNCYRSYYVPLLKPL